MSLRPRPNIPFTLDLLLVDAAKEISKQAGQAFRLAKRHEGAGRTLRPGKDTPLWNALVAELQPHLKEHGAQTRLARLLGLDRQAVHSFVKSRTRMPDAERTLQLVAWLMAVRADRPPA